MKIKESQINSKSKLNKVKHGKTSDSVKETKILSSDQRTVLNYFGYRKSQTCHLLTEKDLHLEDNYPCPELVNHNIAIVQNLIHPDVLKKIIKKVIVVKQSERTEGASTCEDSNSKYITLLVNFITCNCYDHVTFNNKEVHDS
nr:uncharacterized protein LOC124817073 [Hydra vulgaris]